MSLVHRAHDMVESTMNRIRVGNLVDINKWVGGGLALVLSMQESYATLIILTPAGVRMIRFEDVGKIIQ